LPSARCGRWPSRCPRNGPGRAGMLLLGLQTGCVGRRIVHPEVDRSPDHGSDDSAGNVRLATH